MGPHNMLKCDVIISNYQGRVELLEMLNHLLHIEPLIGYDACTRLNFDVIEGTIGDEQACPWLLEQSFRVGTATGAELIAIQELTTSAKTISNAISGKIADWNTQAHELPADSTVYTQTIDKDGYQIMYWGKTLQPDSLE